jgi:hypothetical protein
LTSLLMGSAVIPEAVPAMAAVGGEKSSAPTPSRRRLFGRKG